VTADTAIEQDGRPFPSLLDPTRCMIALFVGAKESGKSDAASRLYGSWPLDKFCIDLTKDAKVASPTGPKPQLLTPPFPDRLPDRGDDGLPLNIVVQPDLKSDTYRDDIDRAVALNLYPRDKPVLGWYDEIGEITPGAQSAGPHMRVLLMQSRHYKASALFCGPRPVNIPRLCRAQADLTFVFELPEEDDRKTLAATMGYPSARFEAECHETWRRGPFWFLLYDRRAKTLWRCPPLPRSPYVPLLAA
jgi:hypothetical protein